MLCTECGTPAGDGQRFCGGCGHPLQQSCPACGYENPPDHRFCGGCGLALGDAVAPARLVPSVERRVVSVLFIDLVGFTTFSEGRDPEDVRSLITDYFDLAREVIERFGGTVDKYIGDAVMAWWGATTSHEDDAERAVRASIELVDRVVTMGEIVGIPGLTARAGVMTGEVSVGPGGNERGLLLGDLVNTASRLQSLAVGGTVLVGATTASLVETAIDLEPAGTHQLKGREEPVAAFRASRVLAERGGKGRSDFLEPPFVGRAAELRLLKDALHASGRDRHARLVSLVGQAGIGKSRLVWEFQKYIDGLVETVYWHEGRSPSYGDGLAMWALSEMVRQRARIQETDDDAVTVERLGEMVAEYVPDERDQAWVQERLGALLGVGGSIGAERTELFAAARLLFEGIGARGTVALVFEDLHWADPALLEFIDELPDWSQNHPILVVTLARPDLLDRRPDWGSGRRGLSSTYLGPLADDEIKEMIRGAVPGIPLTAVDRIAAAAGGVPLFAVEMLRMLVAESRLVIGPTGVEVTDSLEHLDVPSSVQAVVAARLDRLSPEDRELTRDAAVLGQAFTVGSLAGLRDEDADKVDRRLAELVRKEIFDLVRDPRSPERGQYRWVQSVLREVAYGRISRTDRHDLHLRVARQFRALAEPELAPVVSAHFVAASEAAPAQAAALERELGDALREAIDRALVLHAHEQVLTLVDSALPVVPAELEIDLREIAAMAAVRLNDFDRAEAHAAAVRGLVDTSTDVSVRHLAAALSARIKNENRDPRAAAALLEPHLAEFPDFTADPNLARAAVYLARARLLLGDDEGSAQLADRALGAVEKFGLVEDIADALVTRGTALSNRRPHHAMVLLRGALELTKAEGLTDVMLRCLINIGYASPDLDEKLWASEEAYAEAKRVGDKSHASFVAGNLAGFYTLAMNHAGIERLVDDHTVWRGADRLHGLAWRAELLNRRGDRTGAEAAQAEAEELGLVVNDPQSLLAVERIGHTMAMFDWHGRDSFDLGRRHFREHAFAPGLAVSIAMEGASAEGDEALLAEAAEMAATLPPSPIHDGMRRWIAAMRLLATGKIEESLSMVDDIVDGFSENLVWLGFELRVLAARHLPADHPKRAEYIEAARAIAIRTEAPGLVDWIERMPTGAGDGG